MIKLEDFEVTNLPSKAFYVPNFISEDEEKFLLEKIYSSPKPKWKHLSNRRLQNWGGLPHPKGMIPEVLPEWLDLYVKKVTDFGVFGEKIPNHVLVNEYLPGQGIMPHQDGPLFCPVISTINIGSHTVLNYYAKRDGCDSSDCNNENAVSGKDSQDSGGSFAGSLLLEKSSLLIVKDDLYQKYLHGIEEKTYDEIDSEIANIAQCTVFPGTTLERNTRISLTIRHVPHTMKAKFMHGKFQLRLHNKTN